MTFLPPMRSAIMPAGSRHMEPFRTASEVIQNSCGLVSPNSFWIGTPRIPNISHTANMMVKAIVESQDAPRAGKLVGASADAGEAAMLVPQICGEEIRQWTHAELWDSESGPSRQPAG